MLGSIALWSGARVFGRGGNWRIRPERLAQFSTCKVPVVPGFIPVLGRGELSVQVVAKLLFAAPQLECVEPIDDFAHQIAHFVVADTGYGDLPAGHIDGRDIGTVAGVTDHTRTGILVFQSGVGHTDQPHGFRHEGGDLALKFSRDGFLLPQRG